MEAFLILVVIALALQPRGGGNGGRPAVGGLKPAGGSGNPPGGCRQVWKTAEEAANAMNLLGYSPMPGLFGPDGKLGTFDADVDGEVLRFQQNYNHAANRSMAPDMGRLSEDGLMGGCTMAGMLYVFQAIGQDRWRQEYGDQQIGGLTG